VIFFGAGGAWAGGLKPGLYKDKDFKADFYVEID